MDGSGSRLLFCRLCPVFGGFMNSRAMPNKFRKKIDSTEILFGMTKVKPTVSDRAACYFFSTGLYSRIFFWMNGTRSSIFTRSCCIESRKRTVTEPKSGLSEPSSFFSWIVS